jgi:hypothetical protein
MKTVEDIIAAASSLSPAERLQLVETMSAAAGTCLAAAK